MISVDTKKKELVGEFSNGGGEWHPAGEPTRTKTHDFVDKELGRAVPYGVYDLANDEGWVSVGDTADTASFAVEAIRRWWYSMGKPRFPDATKLLITADAGGSNGYRVKLWKVELAKLAQEIGLEITVVHYPPGTSKWNRIEHRMFSFISMNWRGRPLVSVSDHRRADLEHDHGQGTQDPGRGRSQLLRDRHQGQRRRTRCRAAHARTSSTAIGTTRLRNQSIGEPCGRTMWRAGKPGDHPDGMWFRGARRQLRDELPRLAFPSSILTSTSGNRAGWSRLRRSGARSSGACSPATSGSSTATTTPHSTFGLSARHGRVPRYAMVGLCTARIRPRDSQASGWLSAAQRPVRRL